MLSRIYTSTILTGLLGLALAGQSVHGQPCDLTEDVKLTASDASAFDGFGISVSVSGDTAIVGATPIFQNPGAAYIFRRDLGGPDNWGEFIKLTASDAEVFDVFGISVSLDGDTAIIGAHFNDDACPGFPKCDSGSAYIFQRDFGGPDNWGEIVKLTASDATGSDMFGFSVSLSGDTAIVGAFLEGESPAWERGSAYIFQRNFGGPDNWGEVVKLTASDAGTREEFGFSVSLDGDTAIVGAHKEYDDDGGFRAGSAYIFQRDFGGPGNWGEVAKITASDPDGGDRFGASVSISSGTAIVGAWLDDVSGIFNAGATYVFQRDSGGSDNWGQVAMLTASEPTESDWFGYSVSLSGDTAIVGATTGGPPFTTPGPGSAYVFQRDLGGPDNWGEVAQLKASDAADDDGFGVSVSVSGDTVFVGASRNDDAGANSGSAYVFDSVGCPIDIGDCDGDGDVDLVDFASFQLCFTGPGDGPVGSDCNCADFDSDDDVDLADFANFQLAFTGPV